MNVFASHMIENKIGTLTFPLKPLSYDNVVLAFLGLRPDSIKLNRLSCQPYRELEESTHGVCVCLRFSFLSACAFEFHFFCDYFGHGLDGYLIFEARKGY